MAGVLGSHVLCLLLLLSLVLGVASNTDPCSVASTLHNADRRTKSSDPSNGVCDLRLNNTWVRVNTGSGSDLVTSCPALHADCGTSFPVWMSGTIPDVSEGEVTRTACVTSLMSCCEQVLTVGVKNCGDFRVWRLPPTLSCPQAYCFEDPPTTMSSTSSMAPALPFNPATNHPQPPPPNGNHDYDDHHNNDGDVSDKGSPEQGEHGKRTRVLEIALGVVSSLLVLSLVLNAVLVYVWRARSGKSTYSKAQEVHSCPSQTPPTYSEKRPPSASVSPPPPYEMFMAPGPPKVNSWVDKEKLPCF